MTTRTKSPTAAIAHAHQRVDGGTTSLGATTLGVVVSVTDLTAQAGWMAGLAIVALVLAGWRKNARAAPRVPRDSSLRRSWQPIGIAETAVPLYKRPNVLRRIWAVVAGSGLAVVIGAVIATIVAFGLAYIVTTLTDLLKQ
jgi:hypothetical protein